MTPSPNGLSDRSDIDRDLRPISINISSFTAGPDVGDLDDRKLLGFTDMGYVLPEEEKNVEGKYNIR